MSKVTTQKNYTLPKIKATGKLWYVWFRFLDQKSNQMKLVIKKGQANNSDLTTKERMLQLNALKKAIQFKLEVQGWDPITNTYPKKTPEEIEMERLQSLGFTQALDYALTKCNVATKTKLDYGTTIRFFKLAAEQIGLAHKPIVEIKRHHIKLIMEQIKKERKWSNKAFNKNLVYAGAVIDRLLDWEIIEMNPAHNIKSLPVAESVKFEAFNQDEKKTIRDYLFVHHYRYFVYLMIIYHTGIRPKEVLSLKVKDIAEDCSEIVIIPDLVSENSKTKKVRRVPVNQHLQPFLRELGLSDYPMDYYVFGAPYPCGRGYRGTNETGRGAEHIDFFKPSLNLIKRDVVTKLWKKVVKDKLGVNKYQYAMKHSGADDKILAGIDLDALRELYGHSSKFMTEKYAQKVKEVYKKKIMELSPDF